MANDRPKIEITEEMLEAGIAVIDAEKEFEFSRGIDAYSLAPAVYIAMHAVWLEQHELADSEPQ